MTKPINKKKDYEVFLNSKPVRVPEKVSKKVLTHAKAHMSSPKFKIKVLFYRIRGIFLK